MVKRGVPLRASPEFLKALKALKIKVYANGEEISLRDLTAKIADPRIFESIEKNILNDILRVEKDILRYDRR